MLTPQEAGLLLRPALPAEEGVRRRLFRCFLERAELARDGFLDQAGIARLIQQQAAGRADNGNRLWLLLNAEAWYRMHIRGEGREAMAERIAAQAPAEPAADRAA